MTQCECVAGCIFFNDKMANMPSTAAIYKKKYCETDSSSCARHMVFKALGKLRVPADLFPNQTDKAQQMIMAG